MASAGPRSCSRVEARTAAGQSWASSGSGTRSPIKARARSANEAKTASSCTARSSNGTSPAHSSKGRKRAPSRSPSRKGTRAVTIYAELPGGPLTAEQAAALALGVKLRAYAFDRYKTKRKDGEENGFAGKITIASADPNGARKAWRNGEATADGAGTGVGTAWETATVTV